MQRIVCVNVYALTVCALMVKTNSIFELILAIDIFFQLNANFTLISTKRLQLLPRPPTGAPPLDPAGGLPDSLLCPPTVDTDRRLCIYPPSVNTIVLYYKRQN